MAVWVFVVVLASIVLGAMAQRITGMGFALVITPLLILLMGAHSGVLLVNLCATVSAGIMVTRVYRNIDWRMFWWLIIPAMVGCVLGAWFTVNLAAPPLEIGVGIFLLVALSASMLLSHASVTVGGGAVRLPVGLVAGMTNAMAGVAGPVTSAYAVLSHWRQRSFAATMQPFFGLLGLISFVTKAALAPGQWPMLDWWMWPAVLVAILVGQFVGELVYMPDRLARRGVVLIAYLGSAAALVKGMIDLAVG